MKEKITNQDGNTLVELIMVMLLLILFGITIFTLIQAGSQTQNKINNEKSAQVEARIAMSYINVRLHQNDQKDKLTIVPNAIDGKNAILIQDRSDEWELDTWVYWSDGRLKENLVSPGELPDDSPGMYTEIAAIEGFDIAIDEQGMVTYKIQYDYDGEKKELVNSSYLRSWKTTSE